MTATLFVFSVCVGLAVLGLFRIVRYRMYVCVARITESMADDAQEVLKEFEKDEPVSGSGDYLPTRLGHMVEQTESNARKVAWRARWLWPDIWPRRVADIGELALAPMIAKPRDRIREWWASTSFEEIQAGRNRKDFLGTGYWTISMREVQWLRDRARQFRDSAAVEVVWAATLFALGSLVVALFALWHGIT